MSERDNRIHFRTRGGPTQGWGNVYRLASFAEQCRQRGHGQPLFFAEGPETVASFLRNRGFDVVHLPDGIGIEEERRVLADHSHAEATFLEMLEATPELQRLHRESTNLLVVFDDLCDQVYEADLVVCGQGLPSHANQALSAEGTEFLVGYDYFLMRPEFLEKRDAARTIRPRLERVLVTLGGGRYDVGYLKAAHGLAGSGLELDT
ncbi:MAG TPA: hypothetical protein ENJ09_13995, partial [Planctomycetes bacterium]|nr:hypothetical protein [Planctomycetota bacterium]